MLLVDRMLNHGLSDNLGNLLLVIAFIPFALTQLALRFGRAD